MTCPRCGASMNHHADKVVYATAGAVDARLGGVVEELHACPACGAGASRPAPPSH